MKSVPINNHDHPLYPRKNSNRKRKRIENGHDNDENPKEHKRQKTAVSNKNSCHSPIRSPDVRKRKLEHSAPVILCSKLKEDQLDDWGDFQTKFKSVCTFVSSWNHHVTHLV